MADSIIDTVTPTELKDNKQKNKNAQTKGKYPTKTTLNLMQIKPKSESASNAIIGILLGILILAALAVYGIYLPEQKLQNKRLTLEASKETLDTLNESLKDYSEIEQKYIRYTDGFKTEDEFALVDRDEILKMIEEVLIPCGDITSITAKDDVVNVIINVDSYETLSKAVVALSEYDIVDTVLPEYAKDNELETLASIQIKLIENMAELKETRNSLDESSETEVAP